MHLEIKQGTQVAETVSSAVIDKLYSLAFEDPDKNIYSPLDQYSVVWGNITAPAAYEDAVVYLRERFAQGTNTNQTYGLTIQVNPDDYYIRFKDNNLLQMLMYNRPSSNQNQIGRIGDGIGITKRTASSTGSFGTDYNNIFYVENDGTIGYGTNNTGILASSIISFDELGYFSANRIQLTNGPAHASMYTNLKSIDLTNITDIPESCFRGCTNLRMEVNCPSLTSIGGGAFANSGITRIENLGRITTTGYYNNLSLGPFTRCTNLISAKLPDGMISIGDCCFERCSSLKDVICSWTSMISIGNYAFSGCVSLDFNNRPLYFPNLTSIGSYAFGNNSPISAIYAPKLQITSNSFQGRYNTSQNFEQVTRIDGILYLKHDTAWELPAGSFQRSHIGALVLDGVVPTINSGANGTFAQTNIVGSTAAGSGTIGGIYVSDTTQCTAANGWSDVIAKGLLHNISELNVATKSDWEELETDIERRTVLISEYCGKTPTI